jgi:hypothetical protein
MMVDWICETGEFFGLHASTAHVAVAYFDRFLQALEVKTDRLLAVAVACLGIATKYEEREEDCPMQHKLIEYVDATSPGSRCPFDYAALNEMEVLVLQRFQWQLTCVVPLHFLSYLRARGVLFDDDTISGKPASPRTRKYLDKYTDFFADLCLQDYSFQQYDPSLLAAAIVLASRRTIYVRPLFNPALTAVLGYPEAALVECHNRIWAYYQHNFPKEAATQERQSVQSDMLDMQEGRATWQSVAMQNSVYPLLTVQGAPMLAASAAFGPALLAAASASAIPAAGPASPSVSAGGAAAMLVSPAATLHASHAQAPMSLVQTPILAASASASAARTALSAEHDRVATRLFVGADARSGYVDASSAPSASAHAGSSTLGTTRSGGVGASNHYQQHQQQQEQYSRGGYALRSGQQSAATPATVYSGTGSTADGMRSGAGDMSDYSPQAGSALADSGISRETLFASSVSAAAGVTAQHLSFGAYDSLPLLNGSALSASAVGAQAGTGSSRVTGPSHSGSAGLAPDFSSNGAAAGFMDRSRFSDDGVSSVASSGTLHNSSNLSLSFGADVAERTGHCGAAMRLQEHLQHGHHTQYLLPDASLMQADPSSGSAGSPLK